MKGRCVSRANYVARPWKKNYISFDFSLTRILFLIYIFIFFFHVDGGHCSDAFSCSRVSWGKEIE